MSGSPFFAGYSQTPLSVRQFAAKSPLFYPKLNFMAGIFSADVEAIRSLLPDSSMKPLRITKGRALAAIHCLEYEECDIGPYNELSLSFPIQVGRRKLPSFAEILRSILLGKFHAYVQDLPVTTEVALYGGLDFFNFPKYLADLTFRETAMHRICTLRDLESHQLILEIDGRKIPTIHHGRRAELTTYPVKDGHTLRATVKMNWQRYGLSLLSSACSIRTGPDPRAELYQGLRLGGPLAYLYVPRAEGILFLPERTE